MTPASLRLIAVSLFLYLCSSFFPVAHAQSGPAIQSISPDAVPAGGPDTFITVKGSGFNPSSVITIDNQFLSLPTTFIDEGTLQAVIPYRSTASPGPLFISIKNADTSASTLGPFPFIVFSREPPVVSSVDVSGAPPGATFRMTLSGSHLALAQISFSGSGITVVSSSASETRAWVDVSVAADAPFGPQRCSIVEWAGPDWRCQEFTCSRSWSQHPLRSFIRSNHCYACFRARCSCGSRFNDSVGRRSGSRVGLDVRRNSLAAVFSPPEYNNPGPSLSAVSGNADSSILDIRGGAFLPNSFVQIGSTKLVTLYLGSEASRCIRSPGIAIDNFVRRQRRESRPGWRADGSRSPWLSRTSTCHYFIYSEHRSSGITGQRSYFQTKSG